MEGIHLRQRIEKHLLFRTSLLFRHSRVSDPKATNNYNMILDRVRERTEIERDRPDFISYIVKHNTGKSMTNTEIVSNASLLIAAGTETVATLLPAAAFLLATNPATMLRATSEVRSAFQDGIPIDIQSVSSLKYLSAVIQEALRLFPPVPEGLPRVVPPGGQSICDLWVPGGVSPNSTDADPQV